MLEIDKIKILAKEQGKSMSYICAHLGKANNYLSDINSGKGKMTESVLEQIADILGTTTDYLHGKTDKKNKPTKIDGLPEDTKAIIDEILSMPEDDQRAFLQVVRAWKQSHENK